MDADNRTRAACLTPPAAGGVAVIQVIGPEAPAIIERHLASRRPIDLHTLPTEQLRLCQFVDGTETIDDVLVCVRCSSADGPWIIDLNLHGGPRIVQRTLMALQREGARIVEPAELLPEAWNPSDTLELEAIDCIVRAQTRDVCRWLLSAPVSLRQTLGQVLSLLTAGDSAGAGDLLKSVVSAGSPMIRILQGSRVVVTGRPNAGKSTLINRLIEREQILVSPIPGTTRDYVEQPCAVDGLPVTLVDTAGVREAPDELEREAIARAGQQVRRADLIVQLVDATSPPDEPDVESEIATSARPGRLLIWNKMDLPAHPAQKERIERLSGLMVSAATGEGFAALREAIVDALELRGWRERMPAVFTERQRRLLAEAAGALGVLTQGRDKAAYFVHECLRIEDFPRDALSSAGL